MNKPVTITPEIARLAQQKARTLGTTLADEIAKVVVEEAVLDLDPELGFLLDFESSYSRHDVLAQVLGVNDVVINDRHIDVRAANSEGQVSINRQLADTSYMDGGTLVVKMEGPFVGLVVGHISRQDWENTSRQSSAECTACITVAAGSPLDLAATVKLVTQSPLSVVKPSTELPNASECEDFVSGAGKITAARQKEIVELALHNEAVRQQIEKFAACWSNAAISKIVDAASVWNAKVEQISLRLAAKFKRLKPEQIKEVVCRTGEIYGGQPEAPAFRKALLQSLVQAELMASLKGVDIAKIMQVVDKVLSGQPIVDAVNDFVNNKVAVEMAVAIKRQRQQVEGFMAATAEEIGIAFQQLALQPAYATHSQDSEGGVEAINDALGMLQAGELAQQLRQLEEELY